MLPNALLGLTRHLSLPRFEFEISLVVDRLSALKRDTRDVLCSFGKKCDKITNSCKLVSLKVHIYVPLNDFTIM